MTTDDLVREQHGEVLVLRLNRPEARNALTPQLLAAIGKAMLEAESDPGVRALVLTGTGDRAFCAGMDLRAFAGGELDDFSPDAAETFSRLFRGEGRLPLVGAANATALAGGLELLLACDLIVASATASFGFPEVKRGLFAAGRGTAVASRVTLGVAMELTLTGDPISAERALAVGLVNAVVPAEEVLPKALELAGRIASNGPLGVQATKELVRLSVTDPVRWAERNGELQRSVFGSADAKEGAMAFVEKREPVWQGR